MALKVGELEEQLSAQRVEHEASLAGEVELKEQSLAQVKDLEAQLEE